MTQEERTAARIAKFARCATAAQVRDLIAGAIYAHELDVQPFTAEERAAAAKRLAELEMRGR